MADQRLRFTNARITGIKNSTGKALWVLDDRTPGFALTVSPLGKKVFYFVGRVKGRPTRLKIGVFPGILVEPARKQCAKFIGEVAAGRDVAQRRRAGRATIADLWQHYLDTHARPRKRTWERDEKEYNRLVKPEFGTTLLSEIDGTDIESFVAGIENEYGRGPARKARALLGKMFEIGMVGKWCESNPVRGTYRPDFDPRQRYLKVEEVTAFLAAVDSLKRDDAKDYFRLLLFTGARKSNVGSMEWAEIDFTARLWVIPAGKYKSKKPHVVPLSALALQILQRRREGRAQGQKYVFPSWSANGHYSDPKDAWNRVKEASGIDDLRIHDLRRSLGAWQQATGANLKTIQQSLGHSNIDVTARFYSPMEVEQVRASIDDALAKTLKAAGRVKG
jgi:integrase